MQKVEKSFSHWFFNDYNLPLLSHHLICYLPLRDVHVLSQSCRFLANVIHPRPNFQISNNDDDNNNSNIIIIEHSEWIWKCICEREFGFSHINCSRTSLLTSLPSWCNHPNESTLLNNNELVMMKNPSDLGITNWKEYCKQLIKVFNVEGTRHVIRNGILDFNMRETLWSNRKLYNFTPDYYNFRFEFDFLLETGDSEIRVAFSENKDESDCLLFRISGESDMTGTFLQRHLINDEDNIHYFYQDYSPITYSVWNHIEFHFLSSNTIEIIINGKSCFGIKSIRVSTSGFIGFIKSDYRFDKLFIRNIRGSFTERPINHQE